MEREKELLEKFGLKKIDEDLYEELKDIHPLFAKRYFFAHRDLDKAIKEDFAIVSGRGPSASVHLPHLLLFDALHKLQEKYNCFTLLVFSDDEKYWYGKANYDDALKYSIENAIDILSIGFKEENTKIFIDMHHMNEKFYKYVVKIAKKINFSNVKAIFGLKNESSIGEIFYPAIQVTHILLPTLLYNKRVIVPIGIDQDPFIRLARDVADKLGIKKPASLIMRFLPGIRGEEKMSASIKESAIYISDDENEVKRKIFKYMLSGGRESVEKQRKLGGEIEKCVVFKYLSLFLNEKEEKEIANKCKEGKLLCGECKNMLVEKINEFFDRIRKNREKVKDNLQNYLLF